MHAVHSWGQGSNYLSDQRVPTCDRKRGEGRGEKEHQPMDEIWTRKPFFGPIGLGALKVMGVEEKPQL